MISNAKKYTSLYQQSFVIRGYHRSFFCVYKLIACKFLPDVGVSGGRDPGVPGVSGVPSDDVGCCPVLASRLGALETSGVDAWLVVSSASILAISSALGPTALAFSES